MLFIDIVGSTQLAARLTPEDLEATMPNNGVLRSLERAGRCLLMYIGRWPTTHMVEYLLHRRYPAIRGAFAPIAPMGAVTPPKPGGFR